MSLLRICALPKCLSGRILFERSVQSVYQACRRNFCKTIRNSALKRISCKESPWPLQRRDYSVVVSKTEEVKKRVVKQTQLLDVLEARIQQLQSDILVDVKHHAKVQLVKSVKGPPSGKGPKTVSGEKAEAAKAGQPGAKGASKATVSKSQPSRWMEKLSREKKNKTKKQQKLLQKVLEKPITANPRSSKGSLMLPGSSQKTISSTAKKTAPTAKRSRANMKLTEQTKASASSSSVLTNASVASRPSGKGRKEQVPGSTALPVVAMSAGQQARAQELAEVEELEKKLNQQVSQWASLASPQPLLGDSEGSGAGDARLSIHCYLEACVFARDIERAHRYLLNQHRQLSRRKLLTVDVYNVMMRVWAKKASLNQIGRMFILVEEAGLRPNLASYCAALECMGRNPTCSSRIINRCLSQMEEDGLSVDELFTRCVFRQDERDMVLKAVHSVQPDFRPSVANASAPLCSSPLVKDFYVQVMAQVYWPVSMLP
ncbi:uncharacterized protein FYW47_008290 [Aplochiton taeniatus]